MKSNTHIVRLLVAILALATACKKDVGSLPNPLPASVTVVNAAVDLGSVQVDPFSGGIIYANLNDSITAQSSEQYTVPSGTRPFVVVQKADTNELLVNATYTLNPAGIYSLYIAGQAPSYDTLMVRENSIPTYPDSAVGIRLINLAPDAPAVSMSLDATPMTYDFSGLGYKQQSSFKKYALLSNPDQSTVTFDVWDPGTQTMLASYTLPSYAFYPYTSPSISLSRFKSITLVLSGVSASGYSIFAVPNY